MAATSLSPACTSKNLSGSPRPCRRSLLSAAGTQISQLQNLRDHRAKASLPTRSQSRPYEAVVLSKGQPFDPFASPTPARQPKTVTPSPPDPFGTSTPKSPTQPSNPFAAPAPVRKTTKQPVDPFAVSAPAPQPARSPTRVVPQQHEQHKAPSDQVFPVPPALRRHGRDPIASHVRFESLETLFPGTGVADAFDESAEFRRSLRVAMREDLYQPDPRWPQAVNDKIKDVGSTLMVSWLDYRASGCRHLTQAFEEHGIDLDGVTFIGGLSGLTGEGTKVTGSLIEIVPIGRPNVNHSWHQDSGLDQVTVMLGFPPEDRYRGTGVFSHAVKLTHPLLQPGEEGEVIQWEQCVSLLEPDGDCPSATAIPEECIVRPIYCKGQEVMVYRDTDHLHSAPDAVNREAVWRFM